MVCNLIIQVVVLTLIEERKRVNRYSQTVEICLPVFNSRFTYHDSLFFLRKSTKSPVKYTARSKVPNYFGMCFRGRL